MNTNRRAAFFQQCNQTTAHQRMAGVASWEAFSARWRACQGLPLLHPMHVQYLTPQDFRNGLGLPMRPKDQRRLFRQYVQAAVSELVAQKEIGMRMQRRVPGVLSGELAFIRVAGFCRFVGLRHDFLYGGREDVRWYEDEALLPTRPYGIPVTSPVFQGYWLDGNAVPPDDEEW